MSLAGQVIDLFTPDASGNRERLTSVLKTPQVEILHLSVPKGSRLPVHRAVGEIVFTCLRGRIEILAPGVGLALSAGQLMYLSADTPVAIEGREDAVIAVTIVAPKGGHNIELIGEAQS